MIKSIALALSLMIVPAAAQAGEPVADSAAVKAALSTQTPIVTLMADPAAAAVVEKHMPGITGHPNYGDFKDWSLRQVQPFSQGMITDEMLAAIDAGLKALAAG
ncbi:hypothetical protein [Altererythrobacter aquiaggeris]|uniref:hypothetical protein n=1 Tax=Aestuarierythrobacter aquiaggeris TaxID=1898396 RepID=UPI0030167B48